jgi:cellulose 1,4-beta-cellobiosidase
VECAINCAVDGAEYEASYGVTSNGDSLRLDFVTVNPSTNIENVGSRLYLMADDTHYETFNLLNKEFTFDVDVSNLPCGLNGALYLTAMPADGGVSEYTNDVAGAQYGVGYCDSQCPRDIKFIAGQANVEGWVPDTNNANTGVGGNGSCCAEMDIWEANSISSAYTAHPCNTATLTVCDGNACGGEDSTSRYIGTCDPDGCDFNSYRQGDTTFYGPGMTVDTNSVFTVVTQFITSDGTDTGTISEIRRYYVQNGNIIPNSQSTIPGISGNSLTEEFCLANKDIFNSTDSFDQHDGFAGMTAAMQDGMVLVLSLWDDYAVDMLWLDSDYPTTAPPSELGVARGTCPTTSGVPATVEADSPNAYVIYSNIKVGALNSTFTGGGSSSSSSAATSTATKASSTSTKAPTTTTSSAVSTATGTIGEWGQCGGVYWTGGTVCTSPYVCVVSNPYYSQCLAA